MVNSRQGKYLFNRRQARWHDLGLCIDRLEILLDGDAKVKELVCISESSQLSAESKHNTKEREWEDQPGLKVNLKLIHIWCDICAAHFGSQHCLRDGEEGRG